MSQKCLLNCSATEAKDFFMNEKNYFNHELPNYFTFSSILKECDELIKTNYRDNINNDIFKKITSNLNCKIIIEKSNNYQWRPLEIINPYLYVNLVNYVTKNWNYFIKRFDDLRCENIKCCSIPIFSTSKKKILLNWWNEFEQQIIQENLNYKYMGITDISNCYSSIYTHSIAWAISGKDICKNNRTDDNIIGNMIDKLIREIHNGQTNGIPQGSALMDFIAEILLAYADNELFKSINRDGINDYYILRYRDDYRIFSNNKNTIQVVLKKLTEILYDLNLKLNPDKTLIAEDIIEYSLKRDKHDLIVNGINTEQSMQKRIYSIWNFSKEHPNSGSLIRLLIDYYDNISKDNTFEYVDQILSILVNIMKSSPRIYPQAVAIISKLLELKENNHLKYFNKLEDKFIDKPTVDYFEIWLQRIAIPYGIKRDYQCDLCKAVIEDNFMIWNFSWLKVNIKSKIINESIIKNLKGIIDKNEIDFDKNY